MLFRGLEDAARAGVKNTLTRGTGRLRSKTVDGAAAKWELEILRQPEGNALQSCTSSQMRKVHLLTLSSPWLGSLSSAEVSLGSTTHMSSSLPYPPWPGRKEQSTGPSSEKALAQAISFTTWPSVSAWAQLFVFFLFLMVPGKPKSPFRRRMLSPLEFTAVMPPVWQCRKPMRWGRSEVLIIKRREDWEKTEKL